MALHYGDLAFPFRRFQIGKVYRGERAQRGRFREFYQADIDVIGDGKLDVSNEAEIPSIIYRAFTSLGLERFKIRVNNRKILTGFYEMQGLSAQSGEIMRTVDKLDKNRPGKGPGPAGGAGDLPGCRPGDSAFYRHHWLQCPGAGGPEAYRGRNQVFDQGLEELGLVVKYLPPSGSPEDHFAVDLTIARGWTTTPAQSMRPSCWTTRRSVPSVPGGVMIT